MDSLFRLLKPKHSFESVALAISDGLLSGAVNLKSSDYSSGGGGPQEEEPANPQRQGERAPRIFLSYVRRDSDRVHAVYEELRAMGLDPWPDIDIILPGEDYRVVIKKQIDEADYMLVFVSANYVTSVEGYNWMEIRTALDRMAKMRSATQFLIPIRLDDVQLPADLDHLQSLSHFDTSSGERLSEKIARIVSVA